MKVKEFFKRWKGGIEAITPIQQSKISLMGNVLVLVGVITGLITTSLLRVWWLFIILLGSLLLTSMGFLGTIQKYFALKKINEMMKDVMIEKEVINEK